MPGKISIAGLDKAEVVQALFNAARPSMPSISSDHPMSLKFVRQVLALVEVGSPRFWKLSRFNFRDLHVDLSGDEFDPCFYDKCNGEGAAARAIERLRTAGAGGKGDGA